jgi:hypothetical protein
MLEKIKKKPQQLFTSLALNFIKRMLDALLSSATTVVFGNSLKFTVF